MTMMNCIVALLLFPCLAFADTSLKIPNLKLALVVEDNDGQLDLHEFKTEFEDELIGYLGEYIESNLPSRSVQSLTFATTLERHYYGVTNLQDVVKKARIVAEFSDGVLVMEDPGDHLSEQSLESLIRSAMTGDSYWTFVQRLINASPPLNQIQDVQVTEFGSSGEPLEQEALITIPGSLTIVLCVFASLLLVMTLVLSVFAYNKWKYVCGCRDSACKGSNSSTSSSESGEAKNEQKAVVTKKGRKQWSVQTRSVLPLDAIEEGDDAVSSSICSEEVRDDISHGNSLEDSDVFV